jgi:hypothetical protein
MRRRRFVVGGTAAVLAAARVAGAGAVRPSVTVYRDPT